MIFTIILIIFILLSFIYLCHYYYYNINNIDKQLELYEIFNSIKNNTIKTLKKENFLIDERLIKSADANNYIYDLNNTDSWLNNTFYGNNGLLLNIKKYLNNSNHIRNEQKQKIIDLLTNIFVIQYINHINKHNSYSYKIFNTYY